MEDELENLSSELLSDPDVKELLRIKARGLAERQATEAARASADGEIEEAAAALATLMANPRVATADLDRHLKRALEASRRKAGR